MNEFTNTIFNGYALARFAESANATEASNLVAKRDLEGLLVAVHGTDRYDVLVPESNQAVTSKNPLINRHSESGLYEINGFLIGTYKPNMVDVGARVNYFSYATEFHQLVMPNTAVIPIRKGDLDG